LNDREQTLEIPFTLSVYLIAIRLE